MATNFKNLSEYFYPDNGVSRTYVIPDYQRGYKWSVRLADEQTSVEYLLESLMDAFVNAPDRQFFLQGVTVVEEGNEIILIDGQQRTTTLYLLLWCLDRNNITGARNINIDYSIRARSRDFLDSLKQRNVDYRQNDSNDEIQDIYYFKQAIEQINKELKGLDNRQEFYDFLMRKVCLLYIVIDKSKAVSTFTMMNGNKATMHDEELTKAELLHLVSRPNTVGLTPEIKSMDDTFAIMKEMASIDWENDALRSKYAREWDKWLYWWNRNDVMDYFNIRKPMGLLLEYYYRKEIGVEKNEEYSFKSFRKLMPENNKKAAKDLFKGLRDLQKDFEDVFNNPLSFNYLKCAMIGSNNDSDDKFNMIMYFMNNKNNTKLLLRYAQWRLIGSTHIEITEEYTIDPTMEGGKRSNSEKRRERAKDMILKLSEAQVYNVYDDILYKQLLRLNVKEYNKLNDKKGVKFDFSVWNNKSIEHIYPKSRFYHKEVDEISGNVRYVNGAGSEVHDLDGLLDRDQVFSDTKRYSEHCIGNLVLLYGRDNSEFGALSFDEKKHKFFNNERSLDSRNLLHTISSFANGTWEPKDIKLVADKTITILENDYKEGCNE